VLHDENDALSRLRMPLLVQWDEPYHLVNERKELHLLHCVICATPARTTVTRKEAFELGYESVSRVGRSELDGATPGRFLLQLSGRGVVVSSSERPREVGHHKARTAQSEEQEDSVWFGGLNDSDSSLDRFRSDLLGIRAVQNVAVDRT
jgi:hypothetical protein